MISVGEIQHSKHKTMNAEMAIPYSAHMEAPPFKEEEAQGTRGGDLPVPPHPVLGGHRVIAISISL
jgi:hypothetical protein